MAINKNSEGEGIQMKFFDSETKYVDLNQIELGYNPRLSAGDISSLKQSIAEMGVLTPVLLRRTKERYKLVSGYRRFQSCKELKLREIPANIREITDEEAFNISYIDNEERQNLNPIEEAQHFKKAHDIYGYSTRQMAEKYGESKNYYHRKLQLLELPNEIKEKLSHRWDSFTETHCIHICKLLNKKDLQKKYEELYGKPRDKWNDEQLKRYTQEIEYRQQLQLDLADKIIKNEWTVRQTEKKALYLMKEIKLRDEQLDKEIEEEKKKDSLLDNIYFKSSCEMKEIKDNSIPLIVTSPDYYAGKEYEKYKSFEEYKDNLKNIFRECYRVLCLGGRLCINIGDIPNLDGKGMMLIGSFLQEIFNPYDDIKCIDKIIWKKDDPWQSNPHVKFEGQEGNYRVLPSTEYIFIFRKEGKREVSESKKIKSGVSKEEWKKYVSGLWDIPSVRKNRTSKEKDHPAKYPEELVRRLIRMFSFYGDEVLDPCLGSGTTVKVAREENRIGIGYERNEKYKPIILKKLGEIGRDGQRRRKNL